MKHVHCRDDHRGEYGPSSLWRGRHRREIKRTIDSVEIQPQLSRDSRVKEELGSE